MQAAPQPQQAEQLHRVKLYKLNETGGWDDKGTGEACLRLSGSPLGGWCSSGTFAPTDENRSSIRKQFWYSKRVDSIVRAFGRNGCSLLTGVLLPTGLVSVGPMECANHQSNTVGLCVISEETSKMLMVHRILQDDSYNRQGLCANGHNSSN